ncbi:hypothetical protein BDY21DRAFT_68134 [Lineolata rhizophorae]|uniref:Uncharacterized protein n=1 Tax=Lineolata rhizophorae TaxID=578093 RepID=A0A6A6NVQ0_9PEZI|nr:hypothetical protein BDY21DRAFT_68134 [Lineolata rhizophorae]
MRAILDNYNYGNPAGRATANLGPDVPTPDITPASGILQSILTSVEKWSSRRVMDDATGRCVGWASCEMQVLSKSRKGRTTCPSHSCLAAKTLACANYSIGRRPRQNKRFTPAYRATLASHDLPLSQQKRRRCRVLRGTFLKLCLLTSCETSDGRAVARGGSANRITRALSHHHCVPLGDGHAGNGEVRKVSTYGLG